MQIKGRVVVSYLAVLDGVAGLEHGAVLGSLIAAHDFLELDVLELLLEAHHRAADDRREDVLGEVGAGVADLAVARAVVADNGALRHASGKRKKQNKQEVKRVSYLVVGGN